MRCHYMTSGQVTFTFSVRRRELFLPAGVLLKCFVEATDRELFHFLVDSSPTVRAPGPIRCRMNHSTSSPITPLQQ